MGTKRTQARWALRDYRPEDDPGSAGVERPGCEHAPGRKCAGCDDKLWVKLVKSNWRNAKTVWLMLDTRGNDPRPSLGTLAADCEMAISTVRDAIAVLERGGWLAVEKVYAEGTRNVIGTHYDLQAPSHLVDVYRATVQGVPRAVTGVYRATVQGVPRDGTKGFELEGATGRDNDKGSAAPGIDPQLAELRRYESSLSETDFRQLKDNLAKEGKGDGYVGKALQQQRLQDQGKPVTWDNAVDGLLTKYLREYRPGGQPRDTDGWSDPYAWCNRTRPEVPSGPCPECGHERHVADMCITCFKAEDAGPCAGENLPPWHALCQYRHEPVEEGGYCAAKNQGETA